MYRVSLFRPILLYVNYDHEGRFEEVRARCFTLIVFLVSCDYWCSLALQCVIVVYPDHTHLLFCGVAHIKLSAQMVLKINM